MSSLESRRGLRLADVKITPKLLASVVLLVALACGLVVIGISTAKSIYTELEDVNASSARMVLASRSNTSFVNYSRIVQTYILAANDEESEVPPDYAPTIIAEETTSLQTLSVGGAVMAMDLAEAGVIVFRNAAHGGINVVYRRPDGHIGWIDPSRVSKKDAARR